MPTLKSTTLAYKKVALTTGDPLGIGFEVACKALSKLGPQKKVIFFIFRDRNQEKRQPRYFKLLDQKFLRMTFSDQKAALQFVNLLIKKNKVPKNLLIDLSLLESAAEWVLAAAKSCIKKDYDSLATGPLSKVLVKASGLPFVGHTGAFRMLLPKSKLHMAFLGNKFNVLLASDHISMSEVPNFLNKKTILSALESAKKFKHLIRSRKKIALLGLNPHAGEKGILGNFEKKVLKNLPANVVGPLVPDAAFFKSNWAKFSVFVCMYHDQGLIPFKMIHGQDSGVHITIGLPFVRTSVDHGTAFDIYNKNVANPASMLDAIRLNLILIRGNNV